VQLVAKDSKIASLTAEVEKLKNELKSAASKQERETLTLKDELEKAKKLINQLELTKKLTEPAIPAPGKPGKKKKKKKPETAPTDDDVTKGYPQVGDHVVSMWSSSKWQYFTATIVNFDRNTLKYTIEWDDKDPTGLIVDYFNLALDKIPAADSIAVGSTVLFHQAQYASAQVHGITRSSGLRWHQGVITGVYTDSYGVKRYNGKHTKGSEDGKWITYQGYSEEFTNYKLEDLRMPPNVFDILHDDQDEETYDEGEYAEEDDDGGFDVYVSYVKTNSPQAIKNKEVDLPPTYEEAMLESLCDPRDIIESLKSKGVRIAEIDNTAEDSYLKIASTLKRTKVFIACVSDEYASDETCRMEFQYAKKTLRLPVIPIVVGSGSFEWQLTVVGLLVAGDLYIHFKNREVQESKMTELVVAIQAKIPDIKITDVEHMAVQGRVGLHTAPGMTITAPCSYVSPLEDAAMLSLLQQEMAEEDRFYS